MKIFRDTQGTFYKIPENILKKYEVPLDEINALLDTNEVDGAEIIDEEDDVVGQAHQYTLPSPSG